MWYGACTYMNSDDNDIDGPTLKPLLFFPRWLERAKALAKTHEYEARLSYHHCALVIKGGKLIATGYNALNADLRFDPVLAKRARRLQNENHAEVSAILSVKNRETIIGSKVFVVRVTNDGKYAISRPCFLCQNVLHNFGVRSVIYSVSEYEFGTWRVHNPAYD